MRPSIVALLRAAAAGGHSGRPGGDGAGQATDPLAKGQPVEAVLPAPADLQAEWRFQFDDLRVQLAEHSRLLEELSHKQHVLEEEVHRPVPTYTLHSMNSDGSDIVCLSYHETNEWNPSVGHDGMILYSRWDYVDRGAEITHHPWITTPDGCDARAMHGNYPRDTRRRPYMEAHIRAVPGSRLLAAACAHHGESIGSLVLIDPAVEDDDAMAQVKRVTPEMLFPESESFKDMSSGMFATAWPLSEDFYLATWQPRPADPASRNRRPSAGVYLVDSFGNRELLYRDSAIRCWGPIPLKARPVPPVVSHCTAVGLPPALAAARSTTAVSFAPEGRMRLAQGEARRSPGNASAARRRPVGADAVRSKTYPAWRRHVACPTSPLPRGPPPIHRRPPPPSRRHPPPPRPAPPPRSESPHP